MPPLPPPPPPSAPATSFFDNIDWENIVGVKLFSAIAGIALALAGVFFLKFSIDHGWLQPPIRVALGIITGVALLALCEQKFARQYPATANALDAAALAILFGSFFAAHALWHLIGMLTAFGFLGLVTAVAVYLSVRRDSVFIAVLGLLGGFATPALLGSGHNNPIGLFGYLLLLNAGLSWVAYMKRWPVLTALSLLITSSYQWAWVFKFLTVQKLPLAAGIFLVFPILSFGALMLGRRAYAKPKPGGTLTSAGDDEEEDEESGSWLMRFGPTTAVSSALPMLMAVYLAAVPEFGAQYLLLFGFLLCIDAGLFAVATLRGYYILHLVGALSTIIVTLIWMGMSYRPSAWPEVLGILTVFILFYQLAPILASRLGRPLQEPATRAHIVSGLLFAFFAALARLEPGTESIPLLFGGLFALLTITGVYAILRGAGVVYFIAAFFAVATEAAWSATYLRPERLIPALVIYAAFGLLYLGIPEVARRLKRPLQPAGAGGWLLLVGVALLFFLAGGRVGSSALWGIGVLLAIMNAGLFVESLTNHRVWFTFTGIALSWMVLATWWMTVPLVPVFVPALIVMIGYALLIFGGTHWLIERANAAPDSSIALGPAFVLVAHVFLAVIATQPSLGIPPWPMFAALAVLDVAIAAAALMRGRGELHATATVASAIVLFLWSAMVIVNQLGVHVDYGWPAAAVAATVALLGFAAAVLALAERSDREDKAFPIAVAAAALLGHAVLLVAGLPPHGALPIWLFAGAHAMCVIATLVVAWRYAWTSLSTFSVVISGGALFFAVATRDQSSYALPHLAFAIVVYACYLLYPVVLGRDVRGGLSPYLTAVLASGVFFFLARFDLLNAGYDSIIALLPVTQALILGGLLLLLLRIEPAGRRTLGRLALVSGAALAFVTVAIPLQFEKHWLTLGWILEAAALAWLYRRLPHRGLLAFSAGLAAVSFIRLSANPDVFLYAPRSSTPILNWYLYTYLIAAGSLFAATWLLKPTNDRLIDGAPRLSAIYPALATILLFDLLNIEIADFWSTGPTLTFRFSATLAQDLSYTIGWALFGVALLAAGIVLTRRIVRMAALGLLVITILKCFLHDLGRLGGLYRVGAFVGLAICLTLVAVALQRFVLQAPKEATADTPTDAPIEG